MRTVSTLCASGAGIGIASVGLAVVREETVLREPSSFNPSPPTPAMTAVAAYHQPNLNSPFGFSAPQSARSVSEGANGKAQSSNARVGQKRILTPRASFSLGMERVPDHENNGRSPAGTPNTQPQSWLRRLSSSMSRDSSRTPTSRPGSAAISHSNGSMAFSHTGSTTPIFPDNTPPPLPPNKLVKRASSFRSSNGSPAQLPGSRLPLPVFRRPATSHQRSATLHERYPGNDQGDRMSIDEKPSDARDPQLRHYFVPKVASIDLMSMRRRSSSGIPNPIKRVYPDRKYRPILVSGSEGIKPAQAEVDDGISIGEQSMASTMLAMTPNSVSSPLPVPVQAEQLEESQAPRRSFSIGDLLSTGPQPRWRRSSQSRGKTSGSKLLRNPKTRVVSAPHTTMGSTLSRSIDADPEPPAKRRDLTDPQAAQRGIYASSARSQHLETAKSTEIQLNLEKEAPPPFHGYGYSSPPAAAPSHGQTISPLEERRLPSANHHSTTVRPARVSAAQSEITSMVDSDSEYRSIGDASTDYQSETPFDSYRTRTTRSSSGMRGPHIETIFDESPPNFSSGRSTKLKDFLNEGAFTTVEHDGQYRHSTIEEEESIMGTPVRSLRDNSVTSTPSARLGAMQLFTSSPPAIPSMPDPDEIDWDAPDDEPGTVGHRIQEPSLSARNHPVEKSLPFRFDPALRQSHASSAEVTPHRANGTNIDRANLFDWAEVQPSPGNNSSPPRPRTVHGRKKNSEGRGSRPSGRRPPSGVHARSHSVPVVPDVDGKRNTVVANKFGTWGVGSKVVTEDWNDDFDFDESPAPIPESVAYDDKRTDSGHEMFVPKSIREQQESVVANISLLREWGLLIEELKQLRIRANALEMMNGPYAQAFQEVDAMIELADQESEEQTLAPRRSPPSSPGFDYNAFEEPMPSIADGAWPQGQPVELPDLMEVDEPSFGLSGISVRPFTPPHPLKGRPRKDSEAVARSVIEALQAKRVVSAPSALKPMPQTKKVPFDTATLRHIVPYVKDLKRKVKDALRETEGLYSSPRRRTSSNVNHRSKSDGEPAFRSIFNEPPTMTEAARRKSRRKQAATDHDGTESPLVDQQGDLAKRIQDMNLPR